MSGRTRFALLAAAALAALASPARAADAPAGPYRIGDTVDDFSLKDLYGQTFTLAAARKVDDAAAWAAVAAAAKEFGLDGVAAKDERDVDAVPKTKGDDGKPDADKRLAFVRSAVRPFGLVPDAAAAGKVAKLADVAALCVRSAEAPIVLFCWYSHCPTSKAYEERLERLAGATGARFFALATKAAEKDADIKGYVEGKPFVFRVLDDRDLKLTDRLGGRRTPHAFVLDAKNALRYAGAIDSDQFEEKPEAERAHWLRDALAALAEGKAPAVLQTTPVG
jgi:hypothetical protein